MGGRGSLSGVGAVRREQEEDERDLSFLHYPHITSHHSCIASSILTLLKWMLEVLLGYLSGPRPRNVLSASSEYDKRDGLPPGRTWVLVIMYWLFGTPRSLPCMSLSISPPIRAHPVETSDHSRISPTRSDDDNRVLGGAQPRRHLGRLITAPIQVASSLPDPILQSSLANDRKHDLGTTTL